MIVRGRLWIYGIAALFEQVWGLKTLLVAALAGPAE
jgi:hypothetical protein